VESIDKKINTYPNTTSKPTEHTENSHQSLSEIIIQ
jgi:hypothetical protein